MLVSPEWEVFQAWCRSLEAHHLDSLATRNPLKVEDQAEMLKAQGRIEFARMVSSAKLTEEGSDLLKFAGKYTNDRPPDRRI